MVVSENILAESAFDRAGADLVIVYDGECPFCSRYVALQRVRESVGKVSMVDARDHLSDASAAKLAGIDIDQGMLAIWRGQIHAGAAAVRLLAQLSRRRSIWATIFESKPRADRLYPVLRMGRSMALKALGRRRLG
jgi:predicted DCC family thiol-disulfide oxidoreductase YuxK